MCAVHKVLSHKVLSESAMTPETKLGKNRGNTSSILEEQRCKVKQPFLVPRNKRHRMAGTEQAVANALIHHKAKRKARAGGWEPLLMLMCQRIYIFRLLHCLFSL